MLRSATQGRRILRAEVGRRYPLQILAVKVLNLFKSRGGGADYAHDQLQIFKPSNGPATYKFWLSHGGQLTKKSYDERSKQ